MTNNEWDDVAGGWDEDPAARAYAEAAFASLRTALDERSLALAGAVVCDFGCGTGLLTERLVPDVAEIDAVDTSAEMLRVLEAKITARDWAGVRPHHAIPATQASHDLVVCSSVCSFLDDYPAAVQQLSGLLRPGGLFVQWDWEDSGDGHGLSRSATREALTGAGLIEVTVDTAFSIELHGQTASPVMGVGQRGDR